MKRFLLAVVLLTGTILAVMVLLNSLYVRTNAYKNVVEEANTAKFDRVPSGLKVVNLGSSHGEWAFDYNGIPDLRGYNMALSSQDFYYDYQVAKRFRGNLARGSVVLIPVSYFSFGINAQNMPFDYRYYGILPYSAVRGHNMTDYLKYRWCPVMFTGVSAVKSLFSDDEFQADPDRTLEKNNYPAGELKSIASQRAEYHKKIIRQPKFDQDYNISNLKKLLGYCKKEGLKPVLITTPYTDYYNEDFPEDFYKSFYGTIDDIRAEYGAPYLDFSHDQRFSHDPALFRDSDHLNLIGRRQFTQIVIDELKSRGLLQ